MRLPSPTMAELGVAAALSSQVVVYLISESTCVTRRFALSCTESSYTVGLIWGRPRLRKPRLEPHSPASSRPARRCATESRVPERVTRLMPSLSWAMPRVAVRRPPRKRFCSSVGAVGILAQDDLIHAARLGADAAAAVVERKDADQRVFIYFGPRMDAPPADPYEGTLLYDEPGVRAYIFAQRVHAIAHFLRATHGLGAAMVDAGLGYRPHAMHTEVS